MKILVAYDGTVQAKEALEYGLDKGRETGGEVIALHVFDNGLFLDYDVMGAEERARRDSARMVEEAKAIIREKGDGVRANLFTTEGDPVEHIAAFAKDRRADLLLCPPKFKHIISMYRKPAAVPGTEAEGTNLAVISTRSM